MSANVYVKNHSNQLIVDNKC